MVFEKLSAHRGTPILSREETPWRRGTRIQIGSRVLGNSMKHVLSFLFLTFLACTSLHAQEVSAGLSSNEAVVGEPSKILITVRGAREVNLPQTLSVNGLSINLAGRTTQFEMRNFKMTSTLTYTYVIVPQIAGEFTIPSIDVQIAGKIFRTQAMKLSVSGRAKVPQARENTGLLSSDPPPPSSVDGEPFFADLVISKKKACVGELVPVELRFYFNSKIGGQVGEQPNFGGEGFTVQKISNAVKHEQLINETNYVVFSFQGAITPLKAGILEIPSASLDARLQTPANMTKLFADLSNNHPVPQGMLDEKREVQIKTKPQKLEVIPSDELPKPPPVDPEAGQFRERFAIKCSEVFVRLAEAMAGQINSDSPTISAAVLNLDPAGGKAADWMETAFAAEWLEAKEKPAFASAIQPDKQFAFSSLDLLQILPLASEKRFSNVAARLASFLKASSAVLPATREAAQSAFSGIQGALDERVKKSDQIRQQSNQEAGKQNYDRASELLGEAMKIDLRDQDNETLDQYSRSQKKKAYKEEIGL